MRRAVCIFLCVGIILLLTSCVIGDQNLIKQEQYELITVLDLDTQYKSQQVQQGIDNTGIHIVGFNQLKDYTIIQTNSHYRFIVPDSLIFKYGGMDRDFFLSPHCYLLQYFNPYILELQSEPNINKRFVNIGNPFIAEAYKFINAPNCFVIYDVNTNIYNMNENYVCKVYTEVIVPKGTYCTDANSTASIDNKQYSDVKVAVPLWINMSCPFTSVYPF